MGAEIAASLTSLANTTSYHDKSSINGKISELWIQIATPSADQTDVNLFNPYTSLPHAVFSWSEPGSLLAQHVTQLSHNKLSRVQAVIAALLAEALGQEIQYEPPNYTTKHSRLTIASKTLKESAVIRLMNQLRYTLEICKESNTDLYHDLNPDFVPRRILLERGVQSMLAAIEGNLLLTNDNLMDNISVQQPPPTSHHSPPSNHLPDTGMSDKTPVYYVGKQDYGSIAALDKISIGKPPQNVQVEAKHRTHRHALIEMLSSSDKAKLAEKYFALYEALQLRLPKTDHVNHQLKLEIDGTSITAIDCHRDFRSDTAASPFFNAKNLFLETSLFPAQKDFSIPRHTRDGTHKRNDSRSSSGVGGGRSFHRSDSTDSLFSKRSSHSNRHHAASTPGGAPPRPPRKKKSKKLLDIQMAQNVKKSISHVVKHLVINTQIETCVTEINLDLLRLSKALVDGMSNFQPGSFHPVLGDFTVISGSGPASPSGDPPLRSVEDQFMLAGAWEKMDEYIQLMFRYFKYL